MTEISPFPGRNRLLAALSSADFALLQPDLDPVSPELRQVLETADEPITHNYFIESGLASVVAGNGNHRRRIEVGLIGFDGMTGLAVVLGNDRSPNENFMQVGGEGRRISSDRLRMAMQESRSLHGVLLNFAHAFMNQIASTALSNGTASVEERLARWLLMAHDRMDDDNIPLTHEFLALMLGVRRAGVTVALNALERKAVIRLSRGQIFVVDREGLKASANGAYADMEMPVAC
ncbi:MAG: Crp/Fnr family transcriptional regulator [Methyloceanibacter sp.]|nr:Crp/Fnr family transcriptional regulator [Methyloceanibacter sp.]